MLALALIPLAPAATPSGFPYRLWESARPRQFGLIEWVADNLAIKIGAGLWRRLVPSAGAAANPVGAVRDYLAREARIDVLDQAALQAELQGGGDPDQLQAQAAALRAVNGQQQLEIERIVQTQVTAALAEEGIGRPPLPIWSVFPPVRFRLTELPQLLVVSPRDQIQVAGKVILNPGTSEREDETIEARAEDLGVSALVVPIGGLGAYPTMLPETSSLSFLIDTVVHEWVHNYLTFHPLGWEYFLHGDQDRPIATMNETVADLVGQEVGTRILQQDYGIPPAPPAPPPPSGGTGFDFNHFMRETRLQVDALLAQGQVAEAEQYMEEQRQVLVSQGYLIRKLNQAYFAFYGSYADSPTSVDLLGTELRRLRADSPSLSAFVTQVSAMTSPADLQRALGGQ